MWGGGALERKPHLVRWSIVCLDKSKGGLEVKSLALLSTRLSLANGRGVLQMKERLFWNQVIRGKYGEDRGGWLTREVR